MSCEGFDRFAGERWIYPNNMAIRPYQRASVEKALFNNAMIVLPTGFGKTFIAAVVMYNFYCWYPRGKIIFVAPTRPLVAQQIEECRKISGIPSSECKELTGSIQSDNRRLFWREKRVIFATPQVIENDLENSILPAEQVKCIVIDEAHRAQGSYAYVNIVTRLQELNKNGFRVLALSATPGSDIQKVRQVMTNLLISEVLFRTENSIDLMPYKNQKNTKAWTVELSNKHKDLVERYIKITGPIYKELHRAGLTYNGDSVDKVAKWTLVKAGQEARGKESGKLRGRLGFLCNVAITLSHNFELLTIYGIRSFYSSVMRNLNEPRSNMKIAMAGKIDFDRMLEEIRGMFGDDLDLDPNRESTNQNLLLGHKKLECLRDLLVKHFNERMGVTETRAMVFSKYRESVFDIVQSLRTIPGMKPAAFVGQGTADGRGMKQREQIQMVRDFREGKYNVLVATCVAEEGLDIGEVDLIICYDTSSSPISNTQRKGRTGRKRSGDVQTLLTKGYEEKKLKQAGYSKRQVEEQLYNRDNYMSFRYRDAPRMVPADIKPRCLEQYITPIDDEVQEVKKEPKKRSNKRAKKEDSDNDKDDELKAKKTKTESSFTFAKSLLESDDEFESLDDCEVLDNGLILL